MSRITVTSRTDANGKNNEDAYFEGTCGDKRVLCICDGVGGTDAGEIASSFVVAYFKRWLAKTDLSAMSTKELHSRMCEFAEDLHDNLWTYACDEGKSLATTFLIAVIGERKAVIESIGDSRAYICQRNYLKQITIDQTVRYYEMVTGEVMDDVSEKKKDSTLMQCIGGDPEEVEKPRTPVPVRYVLSLDEDVDILVCSDGLSNKLNELNFQSQLTKKQSSDEALDNLIQLAKKRGERDNITAVLFRRRTK